MTIEKQRTFGESVGLAPVVPTTARLPMDLVECSDGTLRVHEDVHYDCRDNPHGTEEDRLEADVVIVTEVLNDIGKWADDYHTENTDYPNGFPLGDTSHEWSYRIEEWVDEVYGDRFGSMRSDIVDAILDCVDENDAEPEYTRNEYACYSGSGCCLFSFDIEDVEEQVDVEAHDDLRELHERGDLDDVLDQVNCDVFVHRSRRRVKDESTGHYVNQGRKTYNPYNLEHPTFEVYTNPGGQWQFVVSKERMEELLVAAIIDLVRRMDRIN